MSETKFGDWKPEASSVAIEYSLVAIEEIRRAVTEGFQKFSRGGIEVGGVLYGTRDDAAVRILAVRQIGCEHAMGPSFQLSESDKTQLREQLESDQSDEQLAGFVPVGWYVSHTRGEINLTPADLEFFAEFFPESWQVCMVVKPGRFGAGRAGFFVREADGTIAADKSHQEFNLPDRIPGTPDRSARDRGRNDRRPLPYENLPLPQALSQEGGAGYDPTSGAGLNDSYPALGQYDTSVSAYNAYGERRKSYAWLWVVGVVLAAAFVAILGLRFFGPQLRNDPVALGVFERDGQLQMQWNRNSRTIVDSAGATLEIVDGPDTRKVQMTSADLAKGSFTYGHRTGDVQVRLEIRGARGAVTEEAAHYLGSAPAARVDPSEAEVMKLEHDALQDEVTRLRAQNAEQAARIQQLERTLTILQTRLNITTGQR